MRINNAKRPRTRRKESEMGGNRAFHFLEDSARAHDKDYSLPEEMLVDLEAEFRRLEPFRHNRTARIEELAALCEKKDVEIGRLKAIIRRVPPVCEYVMRWWHPAGSCVEIKAEEDLRNLIHEAESAVGGE